MQVACYWLMRMLNRRSVVVIAMALLMLISMAIIYYEAVVATISAIQDHRLLDFGTICVGQFEALPPKACLYFYLCIRPTLAAENF